ncbi:MAG: 4a-hydroxytetrahydrobiopterin dehydratase [Gammaproteobacteria bacterium]|nr:4a-hydroxytetrahydrobiopterin dehydratase [Gammaproteobacteria bacterium]
MAEKLSTTDIEQRMSTVNDWALAGDTIRRTIRFRSFPAAIAFVTEAGFLAEAANHHPDIDIRWRNVTLTLTTHEAGGLTQKDFDLAGQINALSGS